MRKLCLVALCALVLGGCVAPPEDIDRIPDFDPNETRMGQIQERGVLLVGIPNEALPPFTLVNATENEFQGFLFELAQEIADALGVEVEPVFLDDEELILPGRIGVEPPADISFVQIPATEELAKAHPLSHPYWVAHQRLLVRDESGIEGVADLEGEYCSVIDEVTGVDLSELTGASGTSSDIEGCARLLEKEEVDAVTAPDMVLMSVWAKIADCHQPCPAPSEFQIVGDDLTTAGYGAMLPVGSPGWTNFVNATWAETDVEGRWLEFYQKWIAPYGIEIEEPPEMRVEEAAGLFPCEGTC